MSNYHVHAALALLVLMSYPSHAEKCKATPEKNTIAPEEVVEQKKDTPPKGHDAELSEEMKAKREALAKEIATVCRRFFESENRKELENFRYDETAFIKNIDGSPEEVAARFKQMYLQQAYASCEVIELHYALAPIEAQLMETGLSRAEVYLLSIDTMNTISSEHLEPEKLQRLQENVQKKDPSTQQKEWQYALALLYQLEHKQYESEGEHLMLALQARNMLERVYICKKYGNQQ